MCNKNVSLISDSYIQYKDVAKQNNMRNVQPYKKYDLIKTDRLKPNESIIPERAWELTLLILSVGIWTHPIYIHYKTLAIMDGHHRYRAAQLLGLKYIPCFLFRYDKTIKVLSRRTNQNVTPLEIIDRSINGNLYPYKTTQHIFKLNLPTVHTILEKLL